ncbi:polyketide synthase dehydratase domain-containing protein, partial [Streptomyces mirabilis]|uniref:polyketide synthase dehydratase domain-containing protein n=1 Tax=Streptomyces mirabilis TaxID=68239 RepID=UPI00368F706E
VRFAQAVRTLETQGTTTLVEIGPDAVLSALATTIVENPDALVAVPALRARQPEPRALINALGLLHTRGIPVDWQAFYAGTGASRVDLPTYAFRRDSYWLNPTADSTDASGLGLVPTGHPLLGAAVQHAEGQENLFTGRLSLATHPWLADHVLYGVVVFPGTGLLEMAVRAGEEVGCPQVAELTLSAPLVVPERGGAQVQVVLGTPDSGGRRKIDVYSRPEADTGLERPWTAHATGWLETEAHDVSDSLDVWPPAESTEVVLGDTYPGLAERGYQYGPAFQGLRRLWRGDGEFYAEVALAEEQRAEASGFALHPALLDAALHALLPGVLGDAPDRLPFTWSDVILRANSAAALRVRITTTGSETVALTVADDTGEPVASIGALTLRPLSKDALRAADGSTPDRLLRIDWSPVREPDTPPLDGAWAVIGEDTLGLGDLVQAYPHVDALPDEAPTTVVIPLLASSGDDVASAAHAALSDVLGVVRGWLAEERFEGSRLVVVTRGAVAV